MRMTKWMGIVASCLGAGACAGDSASGPTGPGLNVAVAPLTLPGVDDVCYTLEVQNDAGQTVWSQQHVCSSQYGNSVGAITYIGTCDAQDGPDADSAALNTVTLTIENLYTADVNPANYTQNAVADAQWDNPCGKYRPGSLFGGDVDGDFNPLTSPPTNADGYGPCQLVVPCEENADALVEFNITIMRDADQGFFDIAVNFEDIFCSAKVDTCYANNDAIELLFRPDGTRGPTAVVALACTAGPGADVDTVLHLSSIAIECVAQSGATSFLAVDPTAGAGNAWAFTPTTEDPDPTDFLYQYAVYEGTEQLSCDDPATTDVIESCNKRYWNVALGIDPAALPADQTCSITALATASDGGFPDAGGLVTGQLPGGEGYPVIDIEVAIASDGATPAGLVCTRNPLNGDGSGVTTTYTPIGGGSCPLELCYFEDAGGTTHVETWVEVTAGNPGPCGFVGWAPESYLMYLEAVCPGAAVPALWMPGTDEPAPLEVFCSQGISRCCLENYLKAAEAVGYDNMTSTSVIGPYPTTEFCLSSPCIETYLKYHEGVSPTRLQLATTGVDVTTDTLTLTHPYWGNHGLLPGEKLVLTAPVGDTLPSPLVADVAYYVALYPTGTTVQLSATPGGPVIDIQDIGTGGPFNVSQPTQTVSFEGFVDAGLCTGDCVESYLKAAEAVGANGDLSISELAEAGVCTSSCIEEYLKVDEAINGNPCDTSETAQACVDVGGTCGATQVNVCSGSTGGIRDGDLCATADQRTWCERDGGACGLKPACSVSIIEFAVERPDLCP